MNNKSDYFIESCTLHDDQYLEYHDLIQNTNETTSSGDNFGAKSHLSGGGFSYTFKKDNRIILWRIKGNQLELIEQSFVHKLNGNCKRIHFKNATIIPKVFISSHSIDVSHYILITIATTSKLYRLIFPTKTNVLNSIFCDISLTDLFNLDASNTYQINLQNVEICDVFTNPSSGETIFGFLLPNNSICCIQMASLYNINMTHHNTANHNAPTRFEINQPNMVKRLWSGITRNAQDSQCILVSYKFFALNQTTYLISLCKDFKIRIWCLKTQQCIHVEDLVKLIRSNASNIVWEESKIDICKQVTDEKKSILSVLVSTHEEFRIANLNIDSGAANETFILTEISKRIIQKNGGELIDLCLSNFKTWIMYKNEDDSISVLTIPFYENNSIEICMLEEGGDKRVRNPNNRNMEMNEQDTDEDNYDNRLIEMCSSEMDLKETYLKLIFEPFRFSKMNILKSLGILGSSLLNENSLPKNLHDIKEILIKSIEKEVQNHPNYLNCTEEEFMYLNSKCWSKFFSMLKQYDYDSRMPLRLFVEPLNESTLLLIRKNSISTFTKTDLSQIYKQNQVDTIKSYFNSSYSKQLDSNEANDLTAVFTSIKCINEYLTDFFPHLLMPSACVSLAASSSDESTSITTNSTSFQYINMLTDNLAMSNKDFLNTFYSCLHKIKHFDLLGAKIKVILKQFEVNGNDSLQYDIDSMETESADIAGTMITSELTLNSVLASFRNLISKRYDFFRNLCVFINLVDRFNEKLHVSRQVSTETFQAYFNISLNTMNSYVYLKWLSEVYPLRVEKSLWEKNFRRTIDILEDSSFSNFKDATDYNQLLLKIYLQSTAKLSTQSQSLFKCILKPNEIFSSLIHTTLELIWPMNIGATCDFIKYLIFNIQYIHLNSYCFQTKWQVNTKNLRHFLSAHCCLFFDNINQSISLFLKASYNLDKDQNLKRFMKLNSNVIVSNTPSKMNEENMTLMSYYTKVIHYFDLNGNLEAAIELIQNALLKCHFNSANKSKLYCILFKSYMDLDYYDKAHIAMISNFDTEWKRTCLKTFIGELCNKNKTDLLIKFDYGDMFQDVINTLYKRAQTSDLRSHDFYRLLYALHVKNKDYRKAAFYMYECALRLKNEISGINSLKRQEKCYLLCLNLLKIIDKKFAWIALPYKLEEGPTKTHLLDSNKQLTSNTNLKKEFEDKNLNYYIVDLDEINRNYITVNLMIKLSSLVQNQNILGSSTSVDELIVLLVKNNLYDDAITICLAFKSLDSFPLSNIINSLVDRCCQIANTSSDKQENELFVDYEIVKNNDTIKIPLTPYESPVCLKWKLLHYYLEKFNEATYYKNACKRILTIGYGVPHYIVDSFKKIDTHALLKIFVNFGFWEKAIELVEDYIDAILFNDSINAFDIKDSLRSNKVCSVYFPYTAVDNLLNNALKNKDFQINNKEIVEEFTKQIKIYLDQVKTQSESLINLRRPTAT